MPPPHFFQLPLKISQRPDHAPRFGLAQGKRKRESADHEESNLQTESTGVTDYEKGNATEVQAKVAQSGDAAGTARARAIRYQKPSLKQTQYVVLNTILHRCLLEGDFARAARAFSLLLRTDFSGQTFNIRKNGMWGIGAELLLQRPDDRNPSDSSKGNDMHELSLHDGSSQRPYSQANFDAARAYYERLILQYPYQKLRGTRDVTALDLYPAFLSLWTYQVYSRSSGEQARPRKAKTTANASDTTTRKMESTATLETLRGISQSELLDAEAILARIDAVTVAPPFDRDKAILRMRGMVALWVVDLMVEIRDLDRRIDAAERGTSTDFADDDRGDEIEDDEILRLRGRARDAFRIAGVMYHGVWEGETEDDDDTAFMD